MKTDTGRVLTDRAGGPADLSRDASQPEALIPRAGDWIVVRVAPLYGGARYTYHAAQAKRVTAKTVYADANYRNQHSRDNVIAMPDEASARLFEQRANSAFAEAVRRERAAWGAYSSTTAKLIASAMSAEGHDPQGHGAKPASAVPQADAQQVAS